LAVECHTLPVITLSRLQIRQRTRQVPNDRRARAGQPVSPFKLIEGRRRLLITSLILWERSKRFCQTSGTCCRSYRCRYHKLAPAPAQAHSNRDIWKREARARQKAAAMPADRAAAREPPTTSTSTHAVSTVTKPRSRALVQFAVLSIVRISGFGQTV
jgi:hypothetical protein